MQAPTQRQEATQDAPQGPPMLALGTHRSKPHSDVLRALKRPYTTSTTGRQHDQRSAP